MNKDKQIRIFDRQAGQYEKKKEPESLRQWRQKLLQHASGHVLELAVGAGANFPFYPAGVQITATDFSAEMLKKATKAAEQYRTQVEFMLSDINELEFAEHSFDTIVSTLSFCSYKEPLKVLEKLRKWCKPSGEILLLEHGISSNMAFSVGQKILNPLLYRLIGCHHTRNMIDLVNQSGLKITKTESHWLGCIDLIWAKPPNASTLG
ncbi:class I SAM-dependent methyltransferase [Cohnella sp. WQ 127256]|uniref:class I SAM-dependent methyltransferase n=1 Tax=Cohnella sp. WQ 127256 TaxID=2938790 RepID=UPI0021176784|nr:class I SAM-dependent methyltransferase [Cohnella sp. WQ 127256]